MPGIDTEGGRIHVPITSMNNSSGSDFGRYLSNESLEDRTSTTSSTESASNIMHRKAADGASFQDHEFIPTRNKQITTSSPAYNPQQFTRINSNPLIISAQKQLKGVEELQKVKATMRKADDEPDWQSNLSAWKSIRRKQSEEALMRVSEIKKLEDEENEDWASRRKISLGKKFSSLLKTDDENDFSDLGLSSKTSSVDGKENGNERNEEQASDDSPPRSPTPPSSPPSSSFSSHMTTITSHSSSMTSSSITSSDIHPRAELSTSKTMTNYEPVRRKSTEQLSSSMKSRLEAFEAAKLASAERKHSIEPEPDEKFREKLKNFKQISETNLQREEEPRRHRPVKSWSSSNVFPKPTSSLSSQKSDDSDSEDFDKALDDALEESYRSVLEDQSKEVNGPKKNNTNSIFSETDFVPTPSSLSPPSEKPPPPPSEKPPPPPPVMEAPAPSPPKPSQVPQNRSDWLNQLRDEKPKEILTREEEEEIDKQEREIIASLELEEREHRRYMERSRVITSSTTSYSETVTAPPPKAFSTPSAAPTSAFVAPKTAPVSTAAPLSPPPSAFAAPTAAPLSTPPSAFAAPTSAGTQTSKPRPEVKPSPPAKSPAILPTKKKSDSRNYTQHWLVQEAEQRRITELQQRQQQSPPSNPSPVYENSRTGGTVNNYPFYNQQYYMNRQPPPAPPAENIYSNEQFSWNNGYGGSMDYVNENTYANLGETTGNITTATRDVPGGPARIPGPQVPPRNSGEAQDRMLSVSGKKKCSHCKEELGRGAAMIIESLRLFYHLRCFQCCVCHIQLGNGASGTDVRVRNNKLHCQNCYSNDEGLKFSKV